MSASAVCPACGHVQTGNQVAPGATLRCVRCSQSFVPRSAKPAPQAYPHANTGQTNPFAFASSPFQPTSQQETFAPPTETAAEPSSYTALLFIFLLVGFCIVSCGGLGFFVALRGREAQVAEADPEAVPAVPPPAIEPKRKSQVRMPQAAPPLSEMKITPPHPPSLPPFNPPPSFVPPAPVPPPPAPVPPPHVPVPPPHVPPFNFPGSLAPPSPPDFPRPAPPPSNSQTDEEKLTAILQQLSAPQPSRPVFFALSELERLPVQESRREEVAQALEPHLRSTDLTTLMTVTRVVVIWGSESNEESLGRLVESNHLFVRWHAIRALAKLSPTEKTAEKLAARFGEATDSSPLRDAFKTLGTVGEPALLQHLETGDQRARREIIGLLAELGTEAARPGLAKIAETDPDFSTKSRAKRALSKLDERKQK